MIRTTLILLLVLWSNVLLHAQNKPKVKSDSIFHTLPDSLKFNIDSPLCTIRTSRYIKQPDSNTVSGFKSKLTQPFQAGKNTTIHADSSFRNEAGRNIQQGMKQMGNHSKDQTINLFRKFSNKLPAKKDWLRVGGQLRSESFLTTAQNPLIRSELMYSRLYFDPTITLFGLPFTSNLFYTTEANNTYKNNYFSFRLDVRELQKRTMERVQAEIRKARNLDRMRQLDLKKYGLEQEKCIREIRSLEKQMPGLDEWQKSASEEAELNARKWMEQEAASKRDSIASLTENQKMIWEQNILRRKDSVFRRFRTDAEDSLARAMKSGKDRNDTARFAKYCRLRDKSDQLEKKKKEIEELRKSDSALVYAKTTGVRDPDQIRQLTTDQLPSHKLLTEFLTIERLGIGIVLPQYSEFTLNGGSVKGIDIGINRKKVFYDLTLGKTTRQFFGPFTNMTPEYDRNIGVARFGIGELSGNHIAVEYLHAFDPKEPKPNLPKVRNEVFSICAKFILPGDIRIETQAAQSFYRETYARLENIALPNIGSTRLGPEANKAFNLKASKNVSEKTKLEVLAKQTGAAFQSVGNPFLRRNFRELELRYEQLLFKKKISLNTFYKEMRDNLSEFNSSTNRMKGYGLKLSTHFEKYPNLSLGYSPYQQGNNHPDSLYRTNNQFSVTTASLTYKYRTKGMMIYNILNYVRSAMSITGRGDVAYSMYSAIQTIQLGSRHNIILSEMRNQTAPFVDSLNSFSFQLNYTYLAAKNFSTGVLGENTRYMNNAFKAGAGIQCSFNPARNITISFITRYDRVNGLWNLRNADVWTGKLVMGCRF